MTKPLLLDLFCGEGGAALGYAKAGFDVVGIDRYGMKRYPFPMIVADITTFDLDLSRYAAVHASPPCQAHSALRTLWDTEWSNLIPWTLELLAGFNGPWVIENLIGAAPWMPSPVLACGAALGCFVDEPYRYVLKRHRLFSSNVPLAMPPCECAAFRAKGYKVLRIHGTGTHGGPASRMQYPGDSISMRKRLMQIPHASTLNIAQCVPAPYTKLIGQQLMAHLAQS